MQEIIIIGPNGAGKTSFANEYLPAEQEGLVYLNADEIAREIDDPSLPKTHLDLLGQLGGRFPACGSVGRLMSKVVDKAKVQRALDRAARNAMTGSSEVRSGRLRVARDSTSSEFTMRRDQPTKQEPRQKK